MNLLAQFSVVIVLGAFGGVLHHIHYHNGEVVLPKKLVDPETGRISIFMGFIGHLLYGVGAALIAFLTLNPELAAVYRVIGVAFGAGFIGHKYLAKAANTLQDEKKSHSHQLPQITVTDPSGQKGSKSDDRAEAKRNHDA